MLKVPAYTEKLFEGSYIENVTESVAAYVFGKIIGKDNYFNCLCINVMDRQGDVVDIVKYRPARSGYENLPKYLNEKLENKPKQRGEHFLYPFQREMERLIEKEGFLFIGEGLKNSVNAMIRSVPFLSIESTSNASNRKIIAYINELSKKGITFYGMLDGDRAGKKALDVLNSLLDRPLSNMLDFESGLDFIDYIRKEYKWK